TSGNITCGTDAGGSTTPGGSDTQLQYNDGGTTFGGASLLVYDDINTRFGIGTSTPWQRFSVGSDVALDANTIYFASSSAASLTLQYNRAATSTIRDSTIYAWTIATSTTATPILSITTANGRRATTSFSGNFLIDDGAVAFDSATGTLSVDSLQTGPMSFDTDAGIVSWIDMPSSTTTAGIVNSYSAMIDGTPVLTVYGTTTASGNITYGSVGIGTTSPLGLLSLYQGGIPSGSSSPMLRLDTTQTGSGRLFAQYSSTVSGTADIEFAFFTDGRAVTDNLWVGGGADVAEYMKAHQAKTLAPGTLLMVDEDTDALVRMTATTTYDPRLIGIVSTAPGLAAGGGGVEATHEDDVLVTLAGRVPVKVTNEGGDIKAGDFITSSSVPGYGMRATTSGIAIGVALQSFTASTSAETVLTQGGNVAFVGTVLVFADRGYSRLSPKVKDGEIVGAFTKEDSFFSRYHSTSMPAFVIDENGNIGVGFSATSSMAYKLQVKGDIGAQSFINLSTRDAKESIEHLTENDYKNALDLVRDTDLATYNYIGECDVSEQTASSTERAEPITCKKRLGLIAEEAPSQILSVDGKGVDLYQTISLVFAATKAQDERIAKLEAALGVIDPATLALNAPNSQSIVDQGLAWVTLQLAKLGIVIESGVIKATSFVADTLTAKKAIVDSLEIKDSATGEPYCARITNGVWEYAKGICETATFATPIVNPPADPTPAATTDDANTTDPNTATTTPDSSAEVPAPAPESQTSETTTTPEHVPEPIPEPAGNETTQQSTTIEASDASNPITPAPEPQTRETTTDGANPPDPNTATITPDSNAGVPDA
ncbi:MAG: hypothetical protein Greene07144_411, partial [Parcubacteria group bacterium Greene0714_4]